MIGSGAHGVAEAVFLRGYTADITLIAPDRAHDLAPEDQARLRDLDIRAVDGPCQAVAALDEAIVVETRRRPLHVRQRLSGFGLGRAQRAGRPDRRGAERRDRLHPRRRPPAHQRARRLCRRRRRHRPRPDQPRHGRRRRRGDDDQERSGEGAAAWCAEKISPGRGGLQARNTGSATTLPSSRSAMPGRNGIRARLPSGRSISSRSPAPKFSTATTMPSASPAGALARQADQVGMIIFALRRAAAAPRAARSARCRAAPRRRRGRRSRRSGRSRRRCRA